MIHFIIGRAGAGKSSLVRERLLRDLAEGRRAVLLVPEQQTVVWETRMADCLPETQTLNLEITNFTRLANSVFREYGGLADPVADNGSRILLTWRAMVSAWDSLRVYGGPSAQSSADLPGDAGDVNDADDPNEPNEPNEPDSANDPDSPAQDDPSPENAAGRNRRSRTAARREDRAVPHLLSAIDDLKAAGISPAEAERALDALRAAESDDETAGSAGHSAGSSGSAGSAGASGTAAKPAAASAGSLADRLSDAVLVYAAYEELLHRHAIDRGDLLANLADALARHPYFRGKSVYVDSFFSLTAPEERLLERILRQADDVTVTFTCPPDRESAEEELQFGETREFLKTAARLAARAGKETEKIPLTENLRHRNAPDLAAVERYLFRYAEAIPETEDGKPEGDECVRVIRCADSFDEAEACACLIDRLVREEKYRYSDIAVVARNMKTREGLLDSTLRRHGIACFLSESSEISTSPAVRLILAALQVIDGGWQRRDVIRLLKTGLTPADLPVPADAPAADPAAEPADDAAADPAENGAETADEAADRTDNEPVNTSADKPAAASEPRPETAPAPGDVFEIYTGTWNIHGRRLFTAERWTMNPDGYTTELTERGKTVLSLANLAKDRLIPPLNRLAQIFDGGAADVRSVSAALVRFAEEYGAAERLEETARAYEAIGMSAEAAKVRRSWAAVCAILDKMVFLLEDDPMEDGLMKDVPAEDGLPEGSQARNDPHTSLNPHAQTLLDAGRFAGLFAKVARQMDVGTIPTAADEVVLGSSSGVRFDEVKCVILIGSGEGEFPGTVSGEGSFFDDRDKAVLASVGLDIGTPDAALQTARENFMYYRTAASAAEKLFILVPAGENGEMSEGARRAVQILEKRGRRPVSVFGKMPLSEIVYCPAAAEYQLSRRTDGNELALLRSLVGADRTEEVPLTGVRDRVIPLCGNAVGQAQTMNLSQSQIETFAACPFHYVCRFRMKVEPEPKAEIRTPDVGSFVHHVLERFFAGLPEEKMAALPLPKEETEALADGIMRDYIDDLARASGSEAGDGAEPFAPDSRLGYLFLRLKRHVLVFLDAIMQELAQSRFRPAAFELPIGLPDTDGTGSILPIRITTDDGAEVVLRGKADRVDVYKGEDGRKYLRVVDYKTGSKSFSLENAAKGLDVQLLLYLFSVLKYGLPDSPTPAEERIPAGAVYFSIRPASVPSKTLLSAEDAKKLSLDSISRSGVLLADEDILNAMDAGLSGKYAGVKKDGKTGELSSRAGTSLLTAEQFGELYGSMESAVKKIAGEIRSGQAAARPRKSGDQSPCDWCRNQYICRYGRR